MKIEKQTTTERQGEERNNCFRPHFEPARSIYVALMDESRHRKKHNDWIERERNVVFQKTILLAPAYGLPLPTMDDVKRAETSALGHTDYAAKWVYRLLEILRKKS